MRGLQKQRGGPVKAGFITKNPALPEIPVEQGRRQEGKLDMDTVVQQDLKEEQGGIKQCVQLDKKSERLFSSRSPHNVFITV